MHSSCLLRKSPVLYFYKRVEALACGLWLANPIYMNLRHMYCTVCIPRYTLDFLRYFSLSQK